MPNPIFQCTMFFRNDVGQGTTESYYTQNYASHKTCMTGFLTMAAKRINLLGNGCRVKALRVSDTNKKRDGLTQKLLPQDGINIAQYPVAVVGGQIALTALTGENSADVVFNRLLVRMYTGGDFSSWGFKYLVGFPDNVCRLMGDVDNGIVGVPWFNTAAQAWITEMISGRWGLYGKDKTLQPHQILSATINNSVITFTTIDNHGLSQNDTVSLYGGNLQPWLLNKKYMVLGSPNPYSATTFSIGPTLTNIEPLVIANFGFVVKASKVLTNFTDIEFGDFTHRPGARPFGLRPGRRRARRVA